MAECCRVVGHVGNGAAVRLETGGHRRVVPEKCLDRVVGQFLEVLALPVAAQGVALDAVLPALEVDVGELHHALISRATEGLECQGVLLSSLRVADPHEAESHDAAEHGRGVRRLPWRVEAQISPTSDCRPGVRHREVELGAHGVRAGHVQLELELGHHAEVAATAAQPPEQLGVLVRRCTHDLATRGDQLERDHVVAGQPVLSREPPMAPPRVRPPTPVCETLPAVVAMTCGWVAASSAPSREPPWTHARRRSGSTRTSPIGVRSIIRPPSGTASPDDTVSAAANPDLKTFLPCERDSTYDVAGLPTADDQRRVPIDHGVPHRTGLVVPPNARTQDVGFGHGSLLFLGAGSDQWYSRNSSLTHLTR